METQYAIEALSLGKSYGKVKALDSVSFSVKKGEVFGVIGSDGAGKTTLFRILASLLNSDSGSAKVCSLDVKNDYKRIRKIIGYMPGRFSLYPDLSVEENLSFFASLFGVEIKDSYDLIAPIYRQIEPFKNRRAGKLSGGMKQKLALCCALIHRPEVLFLDEPTTGVDAVSRSEFWDMLSGLKDKGVSILVSTPYMDEAKRCDRIALICEGRILTVNTPERIVEGFSDNLFAVSSDNMYELLMGLRTIGQVKSCYPFGGVHHVVTDSSFSAAELEKQIQKLDFSNFTLQSIKPDIEDVFIKLMGNE